MCKTTSNVVLLTRRWLQDVLTDHGKHNLLLIYFQRVLMCMCVHERKEREKVGQRAKTKGMWWPHVDLNALDAE